MTTPPQRHAPSNAQVPALTGFRALAAGMVFIGHASSVRALGPFWAIRYGWTGVNLFFALSGFLFTLLYFDRFAAGAVSLRTYFLKRVFRVLPLTWFLVLASFALHPRYTAGDVLTHLTLTHAYFVEYRYSINPPMWTLCVEESFYLVVPILFTALGALERAPQATTTARRLLALMLALVVLWQACAGVVANLQQIDHELTGRWNEAWSNLTLFGRFTDFAFGIAAGLVALRLSEHRLLRSRTASTLVLAAGVGLWWLAVAWMEAQGGISMAAQSPLFQVYSKLPGAGGALMILGLYGRSWCTPLLSSRAAVYAGKISFALYLVQFAHYSYEGTVTDLIARPVRRWVHHEAPAVLAIYLLVSLIAAALHHGVEEPARRWLSARFLPAP